MMTPRSCWCAIIRSNHRHNSVARGLSSGFTFPGWQRIAGGFDRGFRVTDTAVTDFRNGLANGWVGNGESFTTTYPLTINHYCTRHWLGARDERVQTLNPPRIG
ncbi:MAG: hypothetical protein P8176_13075 [Gammaproteobacteria bacterium]